ncbi:3938_t:CDS:2 [Funneliformis caledonium]|uniref:3938_t:CDS:1 n=1 Tax=Funneliformis caledonium TaxID=1117310 RepID=A0A9N8VSZ1_9GLOM|nr:3938_t:CDS:2 [Funneliformis caledonium]
MSSFLSLILKFSRPTSCILRPAVFFSSTATLFDDALKTSRELVRTMLKERGFTGNLNITSSAFNKNDLRALKVSLEPTHKCDVLPCGIKVTSFFEKYTLPQIDIQTLRDQEFDVDSLKEITDNQVKVFLTDLHEVIKNLGDDEGTEEAVTDTLVNNLLVQIAGMHYHPLRVRTHPRCKLYILGEPYVSATPKFVVNRMNLSVVVVEDKHLKNTALITSKGFGEAQLAVEMLACGSENVRRILRQGDVISDQTIFGIRAISSYFTFYKTVIPAEYWNELDFSLPQNESVVIKRWPEGELPETGLNLAKPNERREILEAFARIRQFLLQ